jgi:phospholipid/cholesterol/gamma-HCH transport system substrate-binding protein
VEELSGSVSAASKKLDTTLESADRLINSVDPKKIDTIVSNVEQLSKELRAASGGVSEAIVGFRRTIGTYNQFGESAQETLKRVDALVAAVDNQKVELVVNDISAASADARKIADQVSSFANKIAAREEDIDQTITDFTQMSNKLNAASNRVDGILVKIDGFLGDADGPSLSAEARSTLASFRRMADNLNAQISPLVENLRRFSGSGLRDVEALVGETRRTVQNLQNTISGFEKNPQRLLFGGETVKQYDGRTRR